MTGESARKRVMYTHSIRGLLYAGDDGLTAGEIAKSLGITAAYVNGILNTEFGFYVDRWAITETGTWAAVWMCIKVPENCPRPRKV